MTSNDAVATVVEVLTQSHVPYMLAGSYSSNYYGVARATRDADFVIQTTPDVLIPLFKSLAGKVDLNPQMSFEGVTGTYRHVARVSNGDFKIEFFYLSDDAHDQSRFARRRPVNSLGTTLMIPAPEDVIIMKLRWSVIAKRSRDLDDARNVIRVQRAELDWSYIEQWCEKHGSLNLLHQILESSK